MQTLTTSGFWRFLALGAAIAFSCQASPSFAQTVTLNEFPVPTSVGAPYDIVVGRDGNLWFTEANGNRIGRISPGAPHTITEFPLPTPGSTPTGITSGPDGNLWFTELIGNKIGTISPTAPNTITEFPLPAGISGPYDIAVGPDGNLWFTEYLGNRISRITPGAPNTITRFSRATPGVPYSIVSGPDGNLWFTNPPGSVGYITPFVPNAITEYPVAPQPLGITTGPDGALWFGTDGQIGRISPASSVVFAFTAAGALSFPLLGPDGNVWWTGAQRIGNGTTPPVPYQITRVLGTPPYRATSFAFPGPSYGGCVGPDGNLWFAGSDLQRGTIIQLILSSVFDPSDPRPIPALSPILFGVLAVLIAVAATLRLRALPTD